MLHLLLHLIKFAQISIKMQKPYYKLKNKKSDKETAIQLYVFHSNFPHRRFVYGFKKSILPILWDENKQRAITDKKILKPFESSNPTIVNDLINLNRKLGSIEQEVTNYFSLREIGKEVIQADDLKNYLDNSFNQKIETTIEIKKENLNDYITRYIQEIESGRRLHKGKRLADGSIKNFKTFQTQFDLFQIEKEREYHFEDIDLTFHGEFVYFFYDRVQPYHLNTVGKHIARIKSIMRASMNEGLHSNIEFTKKDFATYQEETDQVYLTDSEVESIRNLDLHERPQLILHRDLFIIGCYTAQRISDYNRIDKYQLCTLSNGKKALRIFHQKKGSANVFIPMKKSLEKILQLYSFSPPRVTAQKFNTNIKVICKLAGIIELFEAEETIGGEKVTIVEPKYEFVSSHTARRTGATNMYKAGIPTLDIMKLTGHTKESSFLKYIRIGKEETAERLSEHAFFK